MKKNLFFCFLLLFSFNLQAADYFWVGGTGNWSDINHWKLGSSSGNTAGIVPSAGDNVFFGAYSGFTAASKTVTINANAFCKSMTWMSDVTNSPVLTRTGSSRLSVSGNLTLAPSVTYSGIAVDLVGGSNAILTTNGNVSGAMTLTVDKSGSGLTLADDLIYSSPGNTANFLELTAGFLNAQGKKLTLYGLFSASSNNRSLDISNSVINASLTVNITGINKSLAALGSKINTGRFYVDAGVFNTVSIGTTASDYLAINNATFKTITFTSTSSSSLARIHGNNTVDSLFFMGSGAIRNGGNNVKHVVFNGNATIGGGGNIIQYAEARGKLDLIDQANHKFDTLITAANKNILVTGSNTINKYFKAGGLPCDGFTEISGAGNGTLVFAPGAVVDMDNVLLANLAAQGPNTPIAVNGIDNEGNSGFNITEPSAAGTSLFWVGGAGDWNDKTHWSTSSGGAGGACIPFINDNVVFDANSGFSAGNNAVVTTGNTYCKDMTWAAGITGNPVFNESSAYALFVYGSIVLNPTVTMNAFLELRGEVAATLRTNGSSLGANQYNIRKSSPAANTGLTLLDDWNNPNAAFSLIRGVLDIRNRKVNIYAISGSGALNKFLYMNNANVSVTNWSYITPNNVLDATGSYLLVKSYMVTRTQTYHIVDCAATVAGNLDIANTTIGQLTFTNTGLTSGARIHGSNIIRRLEFKGQGMVRYGGNVIDSLITAENRNFYFYETAAGTTINKYFKATHPSCSGLGEVRSGTAAVGTLIFGANAKVDISNVYLENIAATGGGGTLVLPIPFSGANAGGNSGWTISSSNGNSRYWVGGAGDWNDAAHWSTTSGGAGGACIPTVGDDVFFNANSGFGTSPATKTVTVNNGNAYFHNMSWAGVLNDPIFSKSAAWTMECWGNSIVLNPASTLNITPLLLKGSEATVMSGQSKGDFDLQINKPGGGLTLANDYDNINTDFYLVEGGLTAIGRVLNIRGIDNGGLDNNIALDITGSTINSAVAGIRYNGGTTKRSLSAANSIINGNLIANGFDYNIVNASGTAAGNVTISNTNIKALNFTNPSTASTIGVNGANNTIGRLEYKGSGGIYGTGNKIDTLIFFPGNTYTITGGTNTTITKEWFGSGSPCKPTEIKSSNTTPVTITKATGGVDFDYVRLQRVVATGGATFKAREHSTDMGGNTGWAISPYNGAAPILGLGPDLGLKNTDLPYTIKTDGFFGSPLSQYEWKKEGNVISTNKELIVTQPGTYTVKVNFPDGCSVSDDIIVTLVSTDLAVTKSVDNLSPAVGSNVVFTVKAINNGPGAGSVITVSDQLPTGYTYVSHVAPVGSTYDAVTGLWAISNLASAAEASITITSKVNASGIYVNTATISSAANDPEPANNSASVSLVPKATLIVTQPSCALETGTIEMPLITGGTYSVDGGLIFGPTNIFTNLAPADYSVVVKIGANTSSPVVVTINEAPSAPDTPVSGGNQSVCMSNPVQTLTATATVPAGSTITWYDAPKGGNVIANPIINALGTVIYYAEANNGSCVSKSRTPVILSINASPSIDVPAAQSACVSYLLPAITGTNLTGNQAYYTQANGAGTKYLAGETLNTIGTQTLYLFDKAIATAACAGNISVTPNADMSDNVVLQQIFNTGHRFYTRAINPDFWKGLANQPVLYSNTEPSYVYLSLIGDMNIPDDPACTGTQVQVSVQTTFKNEGPVAGRGYSGQIAIVNKITKEILVQTNIQSAAVGASKTFSVSGVVPAADLKAGNLVVILDAETAQDGYKNWTLSGFKATYAYLAETPCPDEKSFQLTINPLPAAPVNGGNQEVCATNPVQTLTATATVPAGTTITWYDAATGGNIVATPTLNTVGTVIYYAEAVSNTCVSATRTPVKLTINLSPVITPIADISSCGPLTLPAIAGNNLSGNQAYYTGINKTGIKYIAGSVWNTAGETTLYAYDEIVAGAGQNPEAGLILANDVGTGYTNVKLQALWPDKTRAFPRLGTLSGNPAVASSFLAFASGADPNTKFSVTVGKLTLPAGYVNAGDQVLVSVGNGLVRNVNSPPQAIPGYAGQIAIINKETNQLLYQTSFSDVPTTGSTPSVAGLVPAADLIAGNIGVYIEFKNSTWRISGLAARYQFVANGAGCPAQEPVKIKINPIPLPPAGSPQTACADSPIQTLTATATVPSGSTVVWYDAATAGNVVSVPTLNTIGTVTYYAETQTGDCRSATRTAIVLTINAQPVLAIHNPAVVCHPATINLTNSAITAGSTAGLTFNYFTDATATVALATPGAVALSGTYYIKGTNPVTGCSVIAPVLVQFVDKPEVTAVHPDCVSGTGSITITSPLGAGFEYSIDNGGTYQAATAFTNLIAGTYNVRAKNTVIPGCESDPNVITINATPTTAMPLVFQPDCDQTEGSIEFPVNAAYEYSIDSAPFTGGNVFPGLSVGPHSIRSRKAGDVCIADPVAITIVASAGRPLAPVATNQQACANSPVQTLMAVATVPGGSTLKWYDAATGGNLVSSPTLNTVGTIVYYAESNTGTCTSTSRTAVRLTITPVPVINVIADKNVCGSLILPAIAGANLSGNQAYYTASNGGGTKYNPGDIFDAIGETTLYAYDINAVASPGTSCPAELSFKVLIRNTTAGSITADQTICKNTVPAALASATDGTGSGSIRYKWESSTTGASAGFNVIAGSTLATYAPVTLNETTWFRRITLSSHDGVECESAATTAIKITVQDLVTPGAISANQTICNNNSPATFSSVADATGSGTISYRWESSTTDAVAGFTTIAGITSADYSPLALTATTWFRRIAISTVNGIACESVPTTAVKVTVQTAVLAGTISADQTVCNNTAAVLTSLTAGTGSGTISYRWESSTTNASTGFTTIAGIASADYSPSALTATTWFRRITISTLDGVACESVPTLATAITVQDLTTAGTISADQTICANTAPIALTSVTDGTGSGILTYRWEQSSASAPAFAVVPGITSAGYAPAALTETTYFRRITISSLNGVLCESVPTTLLKITLQDAVSAGAIASDQTICNGSVPAALTSVTAGAGSGTIAYRWESSTTNALVGFSPIAGAISADYTPAALNVTTYFRRITLSALNGNTCESAPSVVVTISVQDVVTAGTIAVDQIICNNTIPSALTSVTAGSGSGTISYRWEQSSFAASGFTAIPGATADSYSPPALTTSTYFRRITISTQNGITCESAATPAVKITVQGVTVAGTIGADQTICFNTLPAPLNSNLTGSGSGSISYRWESSTAGPGTGFTVIPGAALKDYAPAVLAMTTYFRRITISTENGLQCESPATNVVAVQVQDQTEAGAIGISQTICNNTIPSALTSITAGAGSGIISYRWESSTTSATTGFNSLPGETQATYAPAALTTTTYFRRITISTQDGIDCESQPTVAIAVTVQQNATAGTISGNQTICVSTSPVALASATAGTGSGSISYRWESSTTSVDAGFAVIPGATSSDYAPGALAVTTYYRRITVSTLNGTVCESAPTAAIEVTVQDAVTPGAISAAQTICNNTLPAALASTTAGTGSGAISYRWESSTTGANTGFAAISGATSASYSPVALNSTTWFRRVTISSENGMTCESAPTVAIAITVQDAVTAGAISATQTICNNTLPAALTSTTAGTGSGTISYRWESSTTDATTGFAAIPGVTSADYSPAVLSSTTWFRRVTISSENGMACESAPTTSVEITVQDAVTAGAISAAQTICNNTLPAALTSTTAGTGSGTISYRWESSTTGANTGFAAISGVTSASHSPVALSSTTWFRRVTISSENGILCESTVTASVEITVQDAVTAGAISAAQTICNKTLPAALTSTTAGTGSGTISYRWENSTTDATTGFVVIPGITSASYSPVALSSTTWFRRITISLENGMTCESAPTTSVEITVQDAVTAGAISAAQTICNNTLPAALTSTTAGTGSGTISYRWESSITDATTGFSLIPGVTSADYTPAALSSTTWFRRVTISSENGTVCESAPTAAIAITVQDAVTAGAVSAAQTICNNTVPAALTSTTAGTGSGTITYRWESSTTGATTGFALIPGVTSASYSPVALSSTTWFRRVTISSENGMTCESAPTVAIVITVQDAVTAGAISAAQTICNNTLPAALTSTTAGTGSGTISYRWESSTTDATTGFSLISGVTSVDYTPAALSATTWFRRVTISSENGAVCESAPTAAIAITVQDAVTPGAISAAQTICNNGLPAALTSTTAGTGSGTISYRWESSTTDATTGFSLIPGVTSTSYSPVALSSTTWFRRVTISSENGTVCESAPTAAIAITVQDAVTAGAISAAQTICNNTVPAALTSTTAGTGSGTISYRWESSITDATTGFSLIPGVTSADYTSAALSATTWFRRVTISSENGMTCESAPTVAIAITVQNAVTAGAISAAQTICNNTLPVALTSTTAGTGSGTISYRWESSTADATTGFSLIPGVTSADYTPAALSSTTWFRRVAISSENGAVCESAPTAAIEITVQDAVTAGAISAAQTICNNTLPAALTSTTTGTGSGTISYRWESSIASATTGFAAIPGVTTADYTPAALSSTTWFRRATISSENGTVCESAPTAAIAITVQDAVTAGAISAAQTICNNTVPAALTSTTAGTGSGSISYRWERSTAGASTGFATIPGVTSADYTPAALSSTTWFRRVTISSENGTVCESVPTATIAITVQDAVTAGAISAAQTICNNTLPAALTSTTAGTGSGTISYRWESSTTAANTGFVAIPGITSANYTPTALSSTTWFRRVTISSEHGIVCESIPTISVEITVQDAVTAGAISAAQTICNNTLPAALTSTTAGTGSGTISYRWERSTTGANTGFVAIPGVTSANYTPAALSSTTWFRRVTVSSENGTVCESAPTAAIAITVQDAVTPGAISAAQTICNNTLPAALASTTAGTGSGTITYRWESSTTDATTGFATIPGATSASYSPAALTASTYFRRIAISSSNGSACESMPTAAVKVTVIGELHASAGPDQLKFNSPVFTLDAAVPTSGTGQWTLVSGTLAEPISNDANPKSSVKLLPNSSVTLRWTVTESPCSAYDEVVLTYTAQADVVTVKTLKNTAQTTFTPGMPVVYTIRITNNGPAEATNVQVIDIAPAGTSISSWTATVSSGTVTLPNNNGTGNLDQTIAKLPNAAVVTYEVTVQTPSNFALNLSNTVIVTSTTDDPVPGCASCTSVTISPVGLPVAIDNDAAVAENNRTILIPVLDNDKPGISPFDPATIEITVQPQFGTLLKNADGTITYTPNKGYEGNDTFNYRVKDQLGNWSNVAQVRIAVTKQAIIAPNVITPNGDGKNDTFILTGREHYDAAEVEIYNRWGNQVYKNNNYQDTWSGEGLNEGTYYYIIRLKKALKTESLKGWILIKR